MSGGGARPPGAVLDAGARSDLAARGLRDLEAGRPFEAHEAFEALWRDPAGPAGERPLWKGLAQLAAGWVHVDRGNRNGARRVFARAADTLTACPAPLAGIDVPAVAREAAALSLAVARGEALTGRSPWSRSFSPG